MGLHGSAWFCPRSSAFISWRQFGEHITVEAGVFLALLPALESLFLLLG